MPTLIDDAVTTAAPDDSPTAHDYIREAVEKLDRTSITFSEHTVLFTARRMSGEAIPDEDLHEAFADMISDGLVVKLCKVSSGDLMYTTRASIDALNGEED